MCYFLDTFSHHCYFPSLTFSVHECSAMMTIAAWVSNEAIPAPFPFGTRKYI